MPDSKVPVAAMNNIRVFASNGSVSQIMGTALSVCVPRVGEKMILQDHECVVSSVEWSIRNHQFYADVHVTGENLPPEWFRNSEILS